MSEWKRHPADIARLVIALAILTVALLLAALTPDAVRNSSADLVALVRRTPPTLRGLLLGLAQIAAVLGPPALVAWLVIGRRLRLALTALGAAGLAAVSMALLQGWLDRTVPSLAQDALGDDSWLVGASFPSGTYLAALSAAVIVLGTAANQRWRRVGWVVIGVAALFRLASAVAVPVNLAVTVALGAAAASAVLVAFGAPTRVLDLSGVVGALARAGVDGTGLRELDLGARHSRTFSLPEARAIAKLVGRDERAGELLLRMVRRLRVRGLEDESPGWSAVDSSRHEALASMLAERAGASVPPVLAVTDTDEGDGVLVLRRLEGRRLVDLEPADITDELLDRTWDQIGRLHAAGIAHRWCDATHVLVGGDGSVHLLDLRWARLSAPQELLATDVADLLVSLAILVGLERACAAALRSSSRDRLTAALPLLQPLVLTPTTRAGLKAAPDGLLDELRHLVAAQLSVEDVTLAPVARLTVGRVVGWFGTAFMVYVLLSFVTDWDNISSALGEADWSYVPWLLILSFSGFFGGAMSLIGAVPRPLPFGRTVTVMFGQSFLNRFTPANAGGMALRARYLQVHGSDLPAAAASVGLTSLASGAMQAVLLALLAVWAGANDALSFSFPGMETVAVVILGVLVLIGVFVGTAAGRSLLRDRLMPSLTKVWGDLRELTRSPAKLSLLFGGALVGKLTTILAFVLACRAFDVDLPIAQLSLLYMTANTVASAVPTPGGVGAIEAALVAVLTGAGADSATAVSVVLVFRLATYWVPILPAYLALRRLRSTGVV